MPSSRVLLVDQDVDSLSSLAGQLRERGIRVSLANGSQMACERAKTGGYDVVLAARNVAEPDDGAMGVLDAMSIELPDVPPMLVLVDGDATGDLRVPRHDIDSIVLRIQSFSRSSERPPTPSFVPSAHSLDHGALGDLLVLLATERRSGTLTITTPSGSGEVRLVDGDVVDAVFVRLEGKKALCRMIGLPDGTATFTPGAPAIMRRIHVGTRALVAEAREQYARAAALRERAGQLATSILLSVEGAMVEDVPDIDGHVLTRLRVPAGLDELLDELPETDGALIESVLRLHEQGRIRSLHASEARVQLCGADQLHLVRAAAARSKLPGYAGPARLVFAATPARLAVFGHTVMSLADAFVPQEPIPTVPVPYAIATMKLGDGVELDVVALPLVPVYAPLWPLALAGAAVLVRLDEAASQSLEEACTSVSVPILDARAIFGAFEETSAIQVASLIKSALEAEGAVSA
ncbi:DUF4388 domain-containing protein [Labilithrix luteola]|uniref:DUF4388 domain-containing protein n=1 Tax=Labilithrix luteola TaxID=1391654 RepID=UPI0011BAA8C7|nr:DUF4388 domain-containing protein [Labilithrix luteola]